MTIYVSYAYMYEVIQSCIICIHLKSFNLLPQLQSGFRSVHSTETAVLQVLLGILQPVDQGDMAALVILDLSAAFDTVDHDIMMQRLAVTFSILVGRASWFNLLIRPVSHLADKFTAGLAQIVA